MASEGARTREQEEIGRSAEERGASLASGEGRTTFLRLVSDGQG